MILVTLGTQDKKFTRLLDAIDEQIKLGKIKEEVIVQAGATADYKSQRMKIFDLIAMDEFECLLKKCNILITHGGVGTIMSGLKNNKKIIAVARLKKYGEHTNDHQLQIINNFSKNGYILSIKSMYELSYALDKIKGFKPKKYVSNHGNFVKKIKKMIDEVN